MKIISRIMSVLLVAAMLFAFAGCSMDESEKFVGKWKTEMDISEEFKAALESDEESAEVVQYLNSDGLSLVMYITFDEDGTYDISVDAEKLSDDLTVMLDACFRAYFDAYFTASIAE